MSCTFRTHLGTPLDSHILYCTKHTFYLMVGDATCSTAPALPSRLKTCFLEPESLSFSKDNDTHLLYSLPRKILKWEVSHSMLPRVTCAPREDYRRQRVLEVSFSRHLWCWLLVLLFYYWRCHRHLPVWWCVVLVDVQLLRLLPQLDSRRENQGFSTGLYSKKSVSAITTLKKHCQSAIT